VGWVESGPPRALPVIYTIEEMERFEVARPDAGLRGKALQWWHRMKELAAETRLTFGGREGRVEVGALALGGLSQHMIAIDLVGQDFYWWMIEYPDACHRFLAKISQGEIEAEEVTHRIDPRPRGEMIGEVIAPCVAADPDFHPSTVCCGTSGHTRHEPGIEQSGSNG